MYNSIQYFTEKVIPQIEKKREKFMENPTELGSIVVELKEILSEFECCILSEMLTDCNTALENSLGKQRREKSTLADKRQGRTKPANNAGNGAFYSYQIYTKRNRRNSVSFR